MDRVSEIHSILVIFGSLNCSLYLFTCGCSVALSTSVFYLDYFLSVSEVSLHQFFDGKRQPCEV